MNNKNKAKSRHGSLSFSSFPLSLPPSPYPLPPSLKKMVCLLIEKAPTKTMGDFQVPQIHLKKVQSPGFFYVTGRGRQEWHLGASRDPGKVVLSLLTLDVVSLVTFLQIFVKQYVPPSSPTEV